jgi:hypothetical protein
MPSTAPITPNMPGDSPSPLSSTTPTIPGVAK